MTKEQFSKEIRMYWRLTSFWIDAGVMPCDVGYYHGTLSIYVHNGWRDVRYHHRHQITKLVMQGRSVLDALSLVFLSECL